MSEGPTQAELRAERLAEEAARRPSRRMAWVAVGVWVALFALMAFVLPGLAVEVGGRRATALVTTLRLEPGSVTVCALFLAALATAHRAEGPGLAARDFVRLSLGLGLASGVLLALQLLTAACFGAPAEPSDALVVLLLLLLSVLGVACGLGLLVLGLVWLAVAHEVAQLPRGGPGEEVGRVAHLAAPALAAVVLWTSGSAGHLIASPLLVVPAPLAVALTLSGLVVGLAVWLRLRRPRPLEG